MPWQAHYPLEIVHALREATPGHDDCNFTSAEMPRIARQQVSSARMPIRELQLAQLVDEPPEGPEWLHEQKFDGYRILADRDGDRVKLLSRRFKDWTAEFPTVAKAVAELPCKRAILDGEVAVLSPDGRTSFQGLQNTFGVPNPSLVYFVFDVLAIDDEPLARFFGCFKKKR